MTKFVIKNYNKIFFSVIFLFFFIINIVYFYLNYFSIIEVNKYAFNELFINYQSGLIRRGLLGEIFWHTNKYTLIEPRVFFSIIFFSLYLLQIFLFFKISEKFLGFKKLFVIIIFSPAILLFHIYDPNMFYIKDIFVKFSFLLHAFLFLKSLEYKDQTKKYLNYLKLFILPFLILIILIHEYQVFFIGLHFLISLGMVKNNLNLKNLYKIYIFLLIPFFLVILFFGNENQFDNLTLILEKFDVSLNDHLGGGIIKYLGAFYKWHFFYFSYRDFINLFASIILSILLFYSIFQYLINIKILNFFSILQKKYLLYFIPTLIPVLLTSDHGRNISLITFHLVTFFLILKIDYKKLEFLKNKIYKNFLLKILLIVLIFFYIFMWKLDQFAGFGLRGVPNDIFQSSLFAEIIKFIKFLYNYINSNIIQLPAIKL